MLAPGEPSPRGHARALLRAHLARLAYEPKRHPKGSADVVGGPERDGGKFAPKGGGGRGPDMKRVADDIRAKVPQVEVLATGDDWIEIAAPKGERAAFDVLRDHALAARGGIPVPPVFSKRDDAEKWAQANLLAQEFTSVPNAEGKLIHRTDEQGRYVWRYEYRPTGEVKYRGIALDVANRINARLAENINAGAPPPQSITAKALRDKTMAASIGAGHITLNTAAFGDDERFDSWMRAGRKVYSAEATTAIETVRANLATMPADKQRRAQAMLREIDEVRKYARTHVGLTMESVIDHEIGHLVEETRGNLDGRYDKATRAQWREESERAFKDAYASEWRYKLSAYGGMNEVGKPLYAEFMAESWAAHRLGERLHPAMEALFAKWVTVHAYTRDDGTRVREHRRRVEGKS